MNLIVPLLSLLTLVLQSQAPPPVTFEITLSGEAAAEIASLGLEVPVTGRAYVILTSSDAREPRQQVGRSGVPFWGAGALGP